MSRFTDLFNETPEELMGAKLPSFEKKAKRAVAAFIDNIELDAIIDIDMRIAEAERAFVRGNLDAFKQILSLQEDKVFLLEAAKSAKKLRAQFFGKSEGSAEE